MNSRERVMLAMTRTALPDRVPLQFDLSRSLADRFAEKLGMATHYTTSYYEDWPAAGLPAFHFCGRIQRK